MEFNKSLYCLTTSIVFFSIAMLILVVCYIVFTIIGLVNTSLDKESDLCSESHLWIYSVVSLILLLKFKNTINVFSQNENSYDFFETIIELIILFGICIWGAYEFFGVKCVNELSDTILYKTSFAYWIVNCIILFLLLLIIIIGFFSILCCSNITNNEIKKLINDDVSDKA